MTTIWEFAEQLKTLVDEGHGDKIIVVSYDDVPDYVQELHAGGMGLIKDQDSTKEALFTFYSNDGAYEDVTPLPKEQS